MIDAAEAAGDGQPTVEHDALATAAALSPPADPHPERAVGAAFAGGLALALLLKRLAR